MNNLKSILLLISLIALFTVLWIVIKATVTFAFEVVGVILSALLALALTILIVKFIAKLFKNGKK